SLAGLLKTLVGSEPESWKDDLRDQSVFAFGNGFSSKFFLFDSDREEFLTCRSTTMLCGLYRGVKDPLAHPPEMSPEALGYLPDLKRFVDELEGS
ncbi:MAG: hypothetical protein HRU31_15245, partial [Rhodobacteraceae bacterium]|nr:hypothetical protein [Paracoccaceae bacterium]